MTDSEDGETTSYSRGVPVGYVDKDKDKIYVYNHVQLIVKYHETQNGARVVGISTPASSSLNCTRLRRWIPERCAGTNEWTSSS